MSIDYFTLVIGLIIGFIIGRLFPIYKKFMKFMEKEKEEKK